MIERIETPRLVLRKARADDLEAIFRNVWQDEELSKMMLWKVTKTYEEAVMRMERTKQYQSVNTAFFVCLKDTDEPIGFAGMKEEATGVYEDCGICIARAYQNRGYGKEVVQALVDCAFNELGADKFIYGCWHENTQSAATCKALGFTYSYSRHKVREADGKEYDADYYELINRKER